MAAVKGILPTALLLPLLLLLLSSTAVANVEKTIFLGPDAAAAVAVSPGLQLSDLVQRLDTLTPANGTVRTRLAAQFPTAARPLGKTTWFLLDRLTPRQRYEVRVCWPATVRHHFLPLSLSLCRRIFFKKKKKKRKPKS